ncbi:MAG: zinc-dependent alcohol dehydrogenase family protein [Chlorobi bacterium]|nr:zinc-dependent alcohol dehydrogenase family protein [Chlorobiota bacterium]
MLLDRIVSLDLCSTPLRLAELPVPVPGPGHVLLKVHACGVCHTELDEIEGRTPPSFFPIVPGHQVVGTVVQCGDGVPADLAGKRAGVAWIFSACGICDLCRSGQENLCGTFRATGRDVHGGYAEYMVVPAVFLHPVPGVFTDEEAAPLFCAGAVGYRALRLAALHEGMPLGLTGFGASGHLVLKLARFLHPDSRVYVFARNREQREFALTLGADWAGDTGDVPPESCGAIIDTTPAWKPVLDALDVLRPGGRLVINAIRKESHDRALMAGIDYERHLWMEKQITSVANLTRADVREFLDIAARMKLKPEVERYPLEEANKALLEIRQGKIRGAKVIVVQ